jgi:oligopeptide transport system substrate-binding protein
VDLINIYWLDSQAAYEMWLAKGIDVSPLPAAMREELMEDTRLRPRVRLVSNQAAFYLAFNFESEVFSDPAVRRAFSAAIDREALVADVYGGLGLPMRHFTPPGVLGAPPIDEVGVGYSPDWARLQMAESTVRDCKFLPEIHYLVSNTDLALFHAETLRTMWSRELGCPEENIVIEQAQFGTVLSRTRPDAGADRPDIWDLGWVSYYPDAHNWLSDILHCTESENRQMRPCSPADSLIQQASMTMAQEARLPLYRDAELQFFGDEGVQPVAPLFVDAEYVLVQPWLVYEPARFGGEQYDRYQLDPTTKRLERQQ